MANLSRRGTSRGQLLLIAAFALAALFISLALILNAVIYTENLATRTESTTSDAIAHTQTVEQGTLDLLRYVNEHNTSKNPDDYSDIEDLYRTGFGDFTNGSVRYRLTHGVVIGDTRVDELRGTWIKQRNASRNFTNENAAPKWSPVNGSANGARSFRIEVTDTGPLDDASPFTVTAWDSSSDTWKLEITDSNVRVTDADGTDQCSIGSPPSAPIWINVSAGTVAGTPCDTLDFGSDLGTIDEIQFENADNIQGNYSLMVNKRVSNVDDPTRDVRPIVASPPNTPFTEAALYGAVVEIDYERTTLVYQTEIRVVPGEKNG